MQGLESDRDHISGGDPCECVCARPVLVLVLGALFSFCLAVSARYVHHLYSRIEFRT